MVLVNNLLSQYSLHRTAICNICSRGGGSSMQTRIVSLSMLYHIIRQTTLQVQIAMYIYVIPGVIEKLVLQRCGRVQPRARLSARGQYL